MTGRPLKQQVTVIISKRGIQRGIERGIKRGIQGGIQKTKTCREKAKEQEASPERLLT